MSESKIEDKELNFTREVFLSFFNEQENRLAHGAQLRQEMHDAIDRGERPTGYRVEWVKASAMRLINTLQALGAEFNGAHPDDRCSANDFLDILATASSLFGSKE